MAAAGCGQPAQTWAGAHPLHTAALELRGDPTVRGARLVPESLDLSTAALEPSGAARGMVQGLRFLAGARGAVLTADERLDDLSSMLPLPARLGGGFLFLKHDTVFRAEDWLAHPRGLFHSSREVQDMIPGLDRLYVRTKSGAHFAVDPRSGAELDLGPWPADPSVGPYFALDGWRALALTEVRGVVATRDAGHTWEKLAIPFRVESMTPVRRDADGDGWLELGGGTSAEAFVLSDAPLHATSSQPAAVATRTTRCYLVTAAFEVSPLTTCDEVRPEARRPSEPGSRAITASLRAAIEDGWPLPDGTAVVAENGDLLRISLHDGSAVEAAASAFDRGLGRCHAVPLGRPGVASAFGFVCGGSSGRTELFAYDASQGNLRALRSFGAPRIVQTSAGGAWLVRGPCVDAPAKSVSVFCLGQPAAPTEATAYSWREERLDDTPSDAVGLMADGRIARVTVQGRADDGQVLFSDADGRTEAVPLLMTETTEGMRRFLRRAVWLGTLEELTPGVLHGWLAADGTVVGVEIEADGTLRTGLYVRDLGSPFVSGRYGLGWTRSHAGFETTDGGKTWTRFFAPAFLAPSGVRACGPVGCIADGWLRVGWGERAAEEAPRPAQVPALRARDPAPLWLTCTPTEPLPGRHARVAPEPSPRRYERMSIFPIVSTADASTVADPRADASFSPPPLSRGDVLVHADVLRGLDAGLRPGPLGRVYAWGPATGEWAGLGRWVARWRSPFGGMTSLASGSAAAAPFADAAAARAELGVGRSGLVSWTLAVAEDPAHALLVSHPQGRAPEVTAVDDGGRLAPVLRLDGEPWVRVDAAIRVVGAWYIAAPDDARRATIGLFRVDAGGARLVARVHRLLATAAAGPVQLARGLAGNTLGVVVEGETLVDRNAPRWVVPVEIESGQVGVPQPLGAADLSDRGDVPICADAGGSGWVLDGSWPRANVTVDLGTSGEPAYLAQVYARFRISTDRVCLERLTGETTPEALALAAPHGHSATGPQPGSDGEAALPVVAVTDGALALSCRRAVPAAAPPGTAATTAATK